MSRPIPPPSIPNPVTVPKEEIERIRALADKLENEQVQKKLAKALDLAELSAPQTERIKDTISAYYVTKGLNKDTTIGSTIAALEGLLNALDKVKKAGEKAGRTGRTRDNGKCLKAMEKATVAMRKLTDPTSGIDASARSFLDALGPTPSPERVIERIEVIIDAYRRHPVVDPKVEAWRYFCGQLGNLFDNLTAIGSENATDYRSKRRAFAMTVFDVAGIERPDYDSHPDRLDRLLSVEVSPV